MYANGEGALQDLSKAKYWIKKAYEGGNASTSEVMSCPKLKIGFVSPLN
jgi:TPR repeat protein